MHSSDSADFALDPEALGGFVVRDLASGKDVVLLVDSTYGAATLAYVAARLRGGRDRVVRVCAAAGGGLDFAGLLQQLRQNVEPRSIVQDDDLTILTTLDSSCDRIVLLVDRAEFLEHDALLAVQLACRASIRLKLVFAGQPELLEVLDHPELSSLEGRLLRGVRYRSAVEESDGTEALPMRSGYSRRTRLGFAAGACVVLALSGMLARWSLTRDGSSEPVSGQVAALPLGQPTPPAEPAERSEDEAKADPSPEPVQMPEPSLAPVLPERASGSTVQPSSSPPARRGPVQQAGHSGRRGFAARETSVVRGNEARLFGTRWASENRQTLPRNLAEREGSTDYIGTFAAGPDGVRSFQYRP